MTRELEVAIDAAKALLESKGLTPSTSDVLTAATLLILGGMPRHAADRLAVVQNEIAEIKAAQTVILARLDEVVAHLESRASDLRQRS